MKLHENYYTVVWHGIIKYTRETVSQEVEEVIPIFMVWAKISFDSVQNLGNHIVSNKEQN